MVNKRLYPNRVSYKICFLRNHLSSYKLKGALVHYLPFLFIFGLFKQTLQFLQQIYVKNVHPVYGAGI